MTLRQFLLRFSGGSIRPVLICRDGFMVSAQHSATHYCSPRVDLKGLATRDISTVELGYPNKTKKKLLKYAENSDIPLNTVYANVPMEVIERIIAKEGGIIGTLTRI